MIRVLHTVDAYLNLSENWIYPPIAQVPGVETRVLCGSVLNRDVFPIESERLIVTLPPWDRAWGIPRLLNAVGRRIGCVGMFAGMKVGRWHPQAIHAHFGVQGWENLKRKHRLGVPLITSFYGYDAWLLPAVESVWRERYQELFSAGDLFLVEGPAMRNRLCSLGCPMNKVLIQRIGVNLESLPYLPRDFSAGLKIIMVARFVEKKGFVDGLRACALARTKGAKLTVTIVGDAAAENACGQKIKQELLSLAASSELAGCVQFAGFVPLQKTKELLREHNVFLCPSKHAPNGDAEGGSPVALTEAMATGLLCIGTRHCDIPEVIHDGKTGFLCNEGDVVDMAEILVWLGSRPERLLEFTLAGRRHVEEHFSLPVQMSRLEAIYRSKFKTA